MVRGDWAAMILEPRGELKRCQAASNKTYLSITRDFLLHQSIYRESHELLMADFNVHAGCKCTTKLHMYLKGDYVYHAGKSAFYLCTNKVKTSYCQVLSG